MTPDPSGFEIPGLGGEPGVTMPGKSGVDAGGFEVPGLGGEPAVGLDEVTASEVSDEVVAPTAFLLFFSHS